MNLEQIHNEYQGDTQAEEFLKQLLIHQQLVHNHLEMILNYEINKGNTVTRIDENKWTTAALIINLKNTIDIKEIKAIFTLPNYVEYLENKDTHYDFRKTLFCHECKHGISTP